MPTIQRSNQDQHLIQPVRQRFTQEQRDEYKKLKTFEYQTLIDQYSPQIWLPKYTPRYTLNTVCPGFQYKKYILAPQNPKQLQTPIFKSDPPKKRKQVSWVNKTRKILVDPTLENYLTSSFCEQQWQQGSLSRSKMPSKTSIAKNLKEQLLIINKSVNVNPEKNLRIIDEDLSKIKHTRTIQIQLHPTSEQKTKLAFMFEAFIKMYNITLSFIKEGFEKNRLLKLQLGRDLDKKLDDVFTIDEKFIKQQLLQAKNDLKARMEAKANCIIYTHMLDEAMYLVIYNYKSAFSNFKRTRKPFRIRCWKQKRADKILKIESDFFKGFAQLLPHNGEIQQKNLSGFFVECLGQHMEATLDGRPFDLMMIPSTATLVYNELRKTYILNVPIHFQDDRTIINFLRNRRTSHSKVNSSRINLISLDPGIRTFLTGFKDNGAIKIGEDFGERIYKILMRKNKNKREQQNIKKQVLNKLSTKSQSYFRLLTLKKEYKFLCKKLTYLSDELHWKTIGFLTRNYKTILIGNMSTKSIVKNKTSVLTRITKQKAYALGLYKFKQRLLERCNELGVNYREVDEFNTSKTCSNCGWIDEKLGDNKIFKCKKIGCKVIMDRDVNGSRGIYIKSLLN